MRAAAWVTFDLDMPKIIGEYADRYVNGGRDHETLKDYAEQVARDLKMKAAKRWVISAIRRKQFLKGQ